MTAPTRTARPCHLKRWHALTEAAIRTSKRSKIMSKSAVINCRSAPLILRVSQFPSCYYRTARPPTLQGAARTPAAMQAHHGSGCTESVGLFLALFLPWNTNHGLAGFLAGAGLIALALCSLSSVFCFRAILAVGDQHRL